MDGVLTWFTIVCLAGMFVALVYLIVLIATHGKGG